MTNDHLIQNVVRFWFADDVQARWYSSSAAFDERCRRQFADLVERAARGELDEWSETAMGALALCLLLDQLPRNIYRGSPKAFATDARAVDIAGRAIEQGLDHELDPLKRKFLYMPFMHSEAAAAQARSVILFDNLGDEDSLHHAKEHAGIVERFGRFPHRNTILGRQSTDEEIAFLADNGNSYGQGG